jgi:hypothetical protein
MRFDSTTFWYALFLVISILLIIHIFVKNLLSEPIFRFEIPGLSLTIGGDDSEDDDDSSEEEEQVVSPYNVLSPPHSPTSPRYLPTPHSNRDLIDYIKDNILEMQDNRDFGKVKGHNYYSEFHDSDLHHEETDLSKFFNQYQSVPETTNMMQKLQCGRAADTCKQPRMRDIDPKTGQPTPLDFGSDGTPMYKRDVWTYDNERPMNGGLLDGIQPSDEAQSGFAAYPMASKGQPAPYETSYPYMQSSGKW